MQADVFRQIQRDGHKKLWRISNIKLEGIWRRSNVAVFLYLL